jgi:PAS domain S-box-containing protein
MTGKDNQPDKAVELRLLAEEHVRNQTAGESPDFAALLPEETGRILHELRVHQIELEMQNEELRRAQAELDASRARYFDLYDLAPVGYITVSEQGLILEANLTAAGLLDTTRSALVRQTLTSFIVKEDQDIYYHHRRALFETGKTQNCELRMKRSDSATFWAGLGAAAAQEADGELVCRITMQDITERKQAEAEKEILQAQLAQAQKMESVGRLAGGVAHDFNNMLGVILGNVELVMEQIGPNEPIAADLEEIRKAAERSADLTRQLLSFARKQTVAPQLLDFNQTVEGMLKMLRRLIGEDMDLAWRPGDSLDPVFIDPSQVDQILANLCVNSKDAIAGTGKITIETSNVSFDEAYCADNAGFMPGEFVMLAVSDNGCGMDAETRSCIFEPFFTTKEVGKGTGLGLATVYGAVKQNSGFINVFSEPGRGTTFNIYLPRHTAKSAPRPERHLEPAPAAIGETILLVEDEPTILQLTSRMLIGTGYTVIAATTPGEAIRLAREHQGRIDLLITDVVMPEMNGRDLARNIMLIYPDIKRLFMSGYTANIIAHHGMLDEGVHFIQKPFRKNDLAANIRKIIGVGPN